MYEAYEFIIDSIKWAFIFFAVTSLVMVLALCVYWDRFIRKIRGLNTLGTLSAFYAAVAYSILFALLIFFVPILATWFWWFLLMIFAFNAVFVREIFDSRRRILGNGRY
jgi:hypothetical protein